ncbi:BCCT transporter [Photobacterium jeanii]|uniref:BCCT transporter n=1 Tax=Photobacterium jeanii TaxID=858640 RepID=A0A178K3K2_9GAMM|nr:BCCT family transporter [Photobacterium jeanii]OAN11293.1 BCCT transporter [Photobacterium jeanii]PST90813.1 BCCT transporter [Photobacterium jeanii]
MSTYSAKTSDKLVPTLTIGFILFFLLAALIDLSTFTASIQSMFTSASASFGYWWQCLMIMNFALAMIIATSRYGKIKMGGKSKPTVPTFRWIAMIMCTLLAGGGVFWSAAEPIFHFITPSPSFTGVEGGTAAAVTPALAQSFLHWGFLAWAVLGTLSTIVLMYAHYQCGVKLRPRALLYPILGDKLENHWFGSVIDACSIIAVAAGTIGPIGFLATQLGYSLTVLTGMENSLFSQVAILVGVVGIYSISAFTGMDKGLQWLSRMNVIGAVVLLLAILILGPTGFIFEQFGIAFGSYLHNLPAMSLSADNPSWNSWWTWFFWGWFIGFAPMMAIFIARISKGRSIRELVLTVAVAAPIATNFWFSVLGGTGIYLELQTPGSISAPLQDAGLPAVLLASLSQLPLSWLLIPAFLVLTTTFVATTGDSMAYSIAMAVSGDNEPSKSQRLFWAVMMGVVAGVLLIAGDGGLNALQSFIVITAVPVSFLVAATFISGPIAVAKMKRHAVSQAENSDNGYCEASGEVAKSTS